MTDHCKKPGDIDVKVGFPGRSFCPFSDVGVFTFVCTCGSSISGSFGVVKRCLNIRSGMCDCGILDPVAAFKLEVCFIRSIEMFNQIVHSN